MSGALSQVAQGINQATNVVRGIGTLANSVINLGADLGLVGFLGQRYGVVSPALGAWAAGMQPGSWRGLGFAARLSEVHTGRRVAVHEYPFRDDVWVEDLGRATRTVGLQGFICGDDVFQQRNAFLLAAELGGPAELVHPSLGSLTCVLTEFACAERSELGAVVELNFTFVRSALATPVAPAPLASATPSTAGISSSYALAYPTAALSAVAPVVNTVTAYAAAAQHIVGDASLVVGAATGLAGNFGRYSSGNRATPQGPNATIGSALAAVTSARTLVATTGNLAITAAALV